MDTQSSKTKAQLEIEHAYLTKVQLDAQARLANINVEHQRSVQALKDIRMVSRDMLSLTKVEVEHEHQTCIYTMSGTPIGKSTMHYLQTNFDSCDVSAIMTVAVTHPGHCKKWKKSIMKQVVLDGIPENFFMLVNMKEFTDSVTAQVTPVVVHNQTDLSAFLEESGGGATITVLVNVDVAIKRWTPHPIDPFDESNDEKYE
jgi:arginine repressor